MSSVENKVASISDRVLKGSAVKKVKNSLLKTRNKKEEGVTSRPIGPMRTLTLTESNIKNGTLNLSSIISFFPASSLGGSSATAGLGKPLTLYAVGLDEAIKTDIPRDKKIFRSRALLGFFRRHNLKAGDTVNIWRISPDRYIIHPTV